MWSEGCSTYKWFDLLFYSKRITKRKGKLIKLYIYQRKYWDTVSYIADDIKEKTEQLKPKQFVREYLKEELNLSYIKGTAKPSFVNIRRLKL